MDAFLRRVMEQRNREQEHYDLPAAPELTYATGATSEFIEGVTRDVRRSRRQRLEDWGTVGELAALRALKWNREHPERRSEIARNYAAKPEVKARALESAKRRRAKKPAPVLACRECGVEFVKRGRRGGTVPEFCRVACRQRFRYQQRTPGARRIQRRAA